jgi:hypothetical protein
MGGDIPRLLRFWISISPDINSKFGGVTWGESLLWKVEGVATDDCISVSLKCGKELSVLTGRREQSKLL